MPHKPYYDDNGNELPSVTQVIKLLNHKGLIQWANYIGMRHISYNDYMEERQVVGSLVHLKIEKFLSNEDQPDNFIDSDINEDVNKRFNLFKAWYDETQAKPIWVEKSLVNNRYGGTLDALVQIKNGTIGLIDFKTSNKIKPSQLLQLGGYLNLIEEKEPEMYDKIDFCSIIAFGKELNISSRLKEDMMLYRNAFEKLYMLYCSWKSILKDEWNQDIE